MLVRSLIVTAGLLLVLPCVASAYDALLLDPDEDRIVGEPDVAIADDGATVVAWASHVAEGAQPLNGIRIRRFNGDGDAVGEMFRIDVLPGDLARKPSVDMTPDGSRFVVAWEGGTEGERNKRRIWVRVFDSEGQPLETEFRVDQIRMTHEQWGLSRDFYRDPKVSIAPNGDFVVVWRSEGRNSCDRFNISARRFSRNGVPLGDEFVVNTERSGSQLNPDVDHDASGGFVVVWQSGRWIGTNGEWSQIQGRVFDAAGAAAGDEFPLTVDGLGSVAFPSLVVSPSGVFACAWNEGPDTDVAAHIGARVFEADGAPHGRKIEIHAEMSGRGVSHVSIVGNFDLMVAWNGKAGDRLESPAVMAQVFTAAGSAATDPFPLSPATCWPVATPRTAGARGHGAVVWKTVLADGIVVRRFDSAAPWMDVPFKTGGRTYRAMVDLSRRRVNDPNADHSNRVKAARFATCMRSVAREAAQEFQTCLVRDEKNPLRANCARGLAATADSAEQALPTLLAVLRNQEIADSDRAAVACGIGWFGPDAISAVSALTSALGDDSERIRACAARSLGRIGAVGTVEAIASALSEPVEYGPTGAEMHRHLIHALVDLSENEKAPEAVERYRSACGWLLSYTDDGRRPSDLWKPEGLDRYIQKSNSSRRSYSRRSRLERYDTRKMIDDARHRIEEGLIGRPEGSWDSDQAKYYRDIDRMVERYLAIRSLGRMTACECRLALLKGIAGTDPVPDWAAATYSGQVGSAASLSCLPEILELTEGMGERGAPVSMGLAELLGKDDVPELPVLPVLQAMTAIGPVCEWCVTGLRKKLDDPDPEIVAAAIRGLIAAGPEAIWGSKIALMKKLKAESAAVYAAADAALDLIEIEAEACKTTWFPEEAPELEPPPPPRSAVPPGVYGIPAGGSAMPPHPVWTLPPGSAEPPRPVRTPVPGSALPLGEAGMPPVGGGYTGKPGSGYTGTPKKPD